MEGDWNLATAVFDGGGDLIELEVPFDAVDRASSGLTLELLRLKSPI